MRVPEIIGVKDVLTKMQAEGLITSWELPYENLLTRRSAMVCYLDLADKKSEEKVWKELQQFENFSYRLNEEKTLSKLTYRISFSKEELEKNQGTVSQKILI